MLTLSDIVIRLACSFACGIFIGLERQLNHRLAGIHTCVLVSIGSCLFVFVSASIDNDNSPSRVAAQVVTGIGFLGSGIIIKDNNQIKGLNTAATIWCCGAIGCLCGCGLWLTGMCCGIFISILNYTLRDSLIKRILGKFITEEPKENIV